MPIEIRRLSAGDEAIFDRVADGVFDEPVQTSRIAAYLAAPGHHMIVALADGQVVGQVAAVIHHHPDKVTELYIDEVGTADAWLRQGIARRMVDAMLVLGRELGCGEAWLGTEPDNQAARGLYASYGVEAEPFVMYQFELTPMEENMAVPNAGAPGAGFATEE